MMHYARIFELYSLEFVKNTANLIGVKGGDSSGKSESRCDPAENELCAIRLRRVTAGAIFSANEEAYGPPA